MEAPSASTSATLTVRLIRSFEYRNIKHVVYHDVNLEQKVADFQEMVDKDIQTRSGLPPPFKKFVFDTLKISHKAHGYKTTDPVINTDRDDELILSTDRTLKENGVEHETEISYFKSSDYHEYQKHPGQLTF